eukprot:5479212-Amphidinium_carterae.1
MGDLCEYCDVLPQLPFHWEQSQAGANHSPPSGIEKGKEMRSHAAAGQGLRQAGRPNKACVSGADPSR